MNNETQKNNLGIYQATTPGFSHHDILEMIARETRQKYPHLSPRFYPDHCMQAKINITNTTQSLLIDIPDLYIDILKSENFFAETFKHHSDKTNNDKDGQQYILINNEIEKIGFKFVMKATFGPSFISIWFRNESDNPRLDLPIFYALEILNKIDSKVNNAKQFQNTKLNQNNAHHPTQQAALL